MDADDEDGEGHDANGAALEVEVGVGSFTILTYSQVMTMQILTVLVSFPVFNLNEHYLYLQYLLSDTSMV